MHKLCNFCYNLFISLIFFFKKWMNHSKHYKFVKIISIRMFLLFFTKFLPKNCLLAKQWLIKVVIIQKKCPLLDCIAIMCKESNLLKIGCGYNLLVIETASRDGYYVSTWDLTSLVNINMYRKSRTFLSFLLKIMENVDFLSRNPKFLLDFFPRS